MTNDLASEAQKRAKEGMLWLSQHKCTSGGIDACLCLREFIWVAQRGFLVYFLFQHDRDEGACFVGAFSYKLFKEPNNVMY